MGLEVLNKSAVTNNADKMNTTTLGTSNGFYISLYQNSFYKTNQKYWKPKRYYKPNDVLLNFQGIMLDNISLDLSTPWSDAGGAILGKKIAGFANSKFIKMFAGQSDAGFQPFICSDAWTQQKMSGDASPIKISLKFKAYNSDRLGCTNYNDIIRFLIQICSPMKSASYVNADSKEDQYGTEGIGTQAKNNITNAIDGLVDTAGVVMDAGKNFMNLQKEENFDSGESSRQKAKRLVDNAVRTLNNTYLTVVSKTSNGKNNANFTVLFKLGDVSNTSPAANKIKKVGLDVTELNNGTASKQSYPIDWIITSFNFKPSTEFFWAEKENAPKPLWIDFDLSLETRLSLSNKYIYKIFNS